MDAICLAALIVTLAEPPTDQVAGLAHNKNFVVIATTQSLADEVLRNAEVLRKTIALEWLGEELPAGVNQASIQVRLSADSEDGETWNLGQSSRQHHLIWITTWREKLPSILAHEVSHVVLKAQFHDTLPVWADEGVACLQEDKGEIHKRARLIEQMAKSNAWVELASVLDSKPFAARDGLKYAAAMSLTEFFLERGDNATFLSFSKDGVTHGWDSALSRHYRIRSVRELQKLWQEWATVDVRQKLAASALTVARPNERPKPNPARMDPNANVRRTAGF